MKTAPLYLLLLLIAMSSAHAVPRMAQQPPFIPFSADTLLIMKQDPHREPRALFTTEEDLDDFYRSLIAELKRHDPVQDAQYYLRYGRTFFIVTPTPLSSPFMVENYYSDAFNRACPIKQLEGNNWTPYVDSDLIERIQKGEKPAPVGKKLLNRQGNIRTTVALKEYWKATLEYGRKWATVMQPACFKKANIPDKSTLPPVKVTHQVSGNTVYILDETTFRTPRQPYMGAMEQDLYRERLQKALEQKTPAEDVNASLQRREYYLLGAPIEYQRPEVLVVQGISPDEQHLLKAVCPAKNLEGWEYIQRTSLAPRYKTYHQHWNQAMLPVCRDLFEKAAPHGKQQRQLLDAQKAWSNRRGVGESYRYTLTAGGITRQVTVQSGVVTQVEQLPNKKPLPLAAGWTANGLFARVEQAIRSKAARLEVQYDPKYGYPSSILIQSAAGAPVMTYVISDFRPLP